MNDKKKYTKAFDKIKKVYDSKSKDVRKQNILNNIKDNDCDCKG
jgi:hypothetical protein